MLFSRLYPIFLIYVLPYCPEPEFKTFKESKNRLLEINSASLCSLASRYDNPIHTRFLWAHRLFKISSTESIRKDEYWDPSNKVIWEIYYLERGGKGATYLVVTFANYLLLILYWRFPLINNHATSPHCTFWDNLKKYWGEQFV